MMKKLISRRTTLLNLGAMSAFSLVTLTKAHGNDSKLNLRNANISKTNIREKLVQKVLATPFIDTHEHLIEERDRLPGTTHPRVKSDDWTMLFSHYLNSDLVTAGMPEPILEKLFSPQIDPRDKWSVLEPYWWAVKNTGYGQAVALACKQLYDVDEISTTTINQLQSGYEKIRRPGFYQYILRDLAKIESCQVNCLSRPFEESAMPTLLMQDLSIVGMFSGPGFKQFGEPSGIAVNSLDDWYRVIDWWFNKYGHYAVAVKSQNAYQRDINYDRIPADKVNTIFNKKLTGEPITTDEQKALEDHLFWYAVTKATEFRLPIKLHTGYYAGHNKMPLSRLSNNPSSATDLCRMAPETNFVFMHICYPYYEELIAVAKHYANAYLDLCWAWIINPVAAKDFLKKYLVTAPANKILTFGGDYVPVEPVLGHAIIARRGIALALAELVEEGWLNLNNALALVDPIMHGNARRLFNLAEKEKALKHVKWEK